MAQNTSVTIEYKLVNDTSLLLDIYLPKKPSCHRATPLPAVVYFHGGGLTNGNRKSWLPHWLIRRVNEAGYAFICPDYRLMPNGSVTGHDILQDIKDVFTFLRCSLDSYVNQQASLSCPTFRLDTENLAVAGFSGGSVCAYLAAAHVVPKPTALFSISGMGGDLLDSSYTSIKTEPFISKTDLIDPAIFSDYLHPLSESVSSTIVADSLYEYLPGTEIIPAFRVPSPKVDRLPMAIIYLQLGNWLDYYTGEHEPSLSEALRSTRSDSMQGEYSEKEEKAGHRKLAASIPERHRVLFPQFNVDSSWPPAYLIHGSEDTLVRVTESCVMHQALGEAGVESNLRVVDGMEHFFDLEAEAEDLYRAQFDEIAQFLCGSFA